MADFTTINLLILAKAAPLSGHGWLALAVTIAVFLGLQLKRISVDLLFLSGLAVVTLGGVIAPQTAIAGFSNSVVLLIAALFAAAAGLRTTGALDWVGNFLLGSAVTERAALWRLALVAPVSSVVLNTPLVAMLAPVVIDWCRKRSVSPSRLLLPLSYLTILGGVCTVIGTSTTMVCNAQIEEEVSRGMLPAWSLEHLGSIGFLEIGQIGVPIAALGVGYLMLFGPKLLPNRSDLIQGFGDRRREYLLEMLVQPNCPLVGKRVEDAGLRSLPGLFLIEINRRDELITPVTPNDVIHADDRMVFTGIVETIADLERIPGLVPAVDSSYESRPEEQTKRQLTEAVLSRTCPLIGRTVREANFRQRYSAAIVAVHRNGERLTNKIGNIRLEPGDTLLLQTRGGFVSQHRNNRDFYLVSQVGGSSARRHDRAIAAGVLFTLLIVWLVFITLAKTWPQLAAWLPPKQEPIAAVTIVLAMIASRCLSASQARAAIDLQVLITIAAAIGLGAALQESGAANWIAENLIEIASMAFAGPWLPYALLLVVYLVSMALTETITNVAVASLMTPIAISVAIAGEVSPRPFVIAVAIAASLSFVTPVGYQTNLMVMGPGGYVPRDYLKLGTPLAILSALGSLILIPQIWPLAL